LPPTPTLFPYTTLFRSWHRERAGDPQGPILVATPLGAGGERRGRRVPAIAGGLFGTGSRLLNRRSIEHRPRNPTRQLTRCDERQDRKSTRLNSSHVKIS